MSQSASPDPIHQDLLSASNIGAERALLGCVLRDWKSCTADGLGEVDESLFHDGFCLKVWRGITKTVEQGDAVSLVTVGKQVDPEDALRLADLLVEVPSAATFVDHLRVVKKYAARRLVIVKSTAIRTAAATPSIGVEDLSTMLVQTLCDVETVARVESCRPISTYVEDAKYSLLHGSREAVASGIPPLDKLLHGGFRQGEMVVLAARPSVGKTSLALAFAKNVAKTCQPVLFTSMEMSGVELTVKLLLDECGVASPGQQDLERAAATVEKLAIHVDDVPKRSLQQTVAAITRAAKRTHARLVVVDYLGLIPSDAQSDSAYERVSGASREMKLLARRLEVPLLVVAQLNRAVENRKGKKPTSSDLRDSGTIEQDADVILLLHPKSTAGVESVVDVLVAKNRNGPRGEFTLSFHADVSRFVSGQSA
jgi:replicative DNA helicase